jgi:predicted RND superfamily exporter protein
MEKGIKVFTEQVIRFRWLFLALFLVITAAMIFVSKDLKVNNDYETWLPTEDKVGDLLRTVDRVFSNGSLMLVVIDFSEEGVFTPESLDLVDRLTRTLEGMEELFQVSSLTNIMDIRQTEDGIEVSDLIPGTRPESPEDLEKLKNYVLSKEMYRDSLVSGDAGYTAVALSIKSAYDEIKVTGRVLDLVEEALGGRKFYAGGDVVIAYYMDHYMTQDVILLVPVILVCMLFILGYGLRRVTGVIFAFAVVFITIIWTIGMKSLLSYPFNILSPAVVVLLMAVGSDYAVHMYNHYLKEGDIRVSAREITLPILMSAMTTVAGLATFGVTKIEVLKNFGLELAFGLAAACMLSIVLVTVGIVMTGDRPLSKAVGAEKRKHTFSRAMIMVGGWVHDHTRLIFGITAVLLVVMGLGISRINTSVDFVDMLPGDSPPRSSSQVLEEHFNGMYRVTMYFQGDMEDPKAMTIMGYIENYLRSNELLGGFLSMHDLIAEENWLLNGVFAVPESREGVANLWFMLEGQDILKTFVCPDRKQGLVNSIMKEHDTGYMKSLAAHIQEFLDSAVSPEVVMIDPALLPQQGRTQLEEIRLSHAAGQLAWLAQGYDRPRLYDAQEFQSRLEQALTGIDRTVDMDPVWAEVHGYLAEETVEILPEELVSSLTAYLKAHWDDADRGASEEHIARKILESGCMGEDDCRMTALGMMNRAESSLRIGKADALLKSLEEGVPVRLARHQDFRKRAHGVLWELLAPMPVLFSRDVEGVAGIGRAVAESMQLKIDQTGAHSMFSRFDELLYQSQEQSLFFASLIVLVMISLSQRSFRRGLISLISVLVPLEIVLGFMGWTGIPLDFGTVLCSALIIGLGVDGSIHFLHYYHVQFGRGLKGKESLQSTLGHVGRAVITANATSFLGFIVLMFSKTTELKNFAIINALAIFLVTLSVLTLLPSLASLIHLEDRTWRIAVPMKENQLFDSIFDEK